MPGCRFGALSAFLLYFATQVPASAQALAERTVLDRDAVLQKRFAQDLRRGLSAAGLSPDDINEISRPLVQAGLLRPVPGKPLAVPQSLAEISNQRRALQVLLERLNVQYRIPPLPSREASPIIEGAPAIPPAFAAWNLLRNATLLDNFPLAKRHLNLPRKPRGPLRWATPIRVSGTGNANYDRAIGAAVARLRNALPRVDIAFLATATPAQANVFIDWHGVVCAQGRACDHASPSSLYVPDSALGMPNHNIRFTVPLAFFGQIKDGEWREGSPIYRRLAMQGSVPATAWVRTNQVLQADAGFCSDLIGFGANGAGGRRDASQPESEEAMIDAAEACLFAVLGAPAVRDSGWFADAWGGDTRETLSTPARIKVLRNLYK